NPPSAEVTGTATQPAAKSGFSDMTGYGWAEGYISYAVKHGVTKGYPDGTFKPGNSVTMNELVAMVLRAADYTDETLGGTWPSNYMTKATELNLLAGTPDTLPVNATKWIAAQVDYNALDQIEKANPQETEQSPSQATPSGVPDTSTMTYISGSFNSAMTTFNGKTLADNVKIDTYGLKKDYSSTMTFSKKVADYRLDTVYKYKNVETPAFYKVENNKIVSMVIPKDVGFSGLAYVVINGTYSSTNAKGEAVTGLETFAAGKEIKWLGEKGLTGIPEKTGANSYLYGTVYEIRLADGQIKSIYKSTESHRGDVFDEISGTAFAEIDDYSDNIVTLTNGDKAEIKDNATVYVMDAADRTEYKAGKQSDIKDGNKIRIYDMSDDDEISGDIVVVLAE
ncbi:MAG TPA: S-layer homology domain-containing protein, partial [Anaerovoracaceae bacterium]|nr:S-layer homology domain-containing protein [Anaerovoracaceae bacterium]